MARRVSSPAAAAAVLLLLAGCSNYEASRPAWRAQAENACIADNLVRVSDYVKPAPEINGPGICGLTRPFKVSALLDGAVTFNGNYILDCPMIAALNDWVQNVVQPEAQARFNERVVEIESFGTYSCRGINGEWGARLSEHAFGNAIDVSGFQLADGRKIMVVHDWYEGADPQAQAFLHDIHAGACGYFTTVLGPGYNIFHYNHFHLDLAMHGNTSTGPRRVCRPEPQVMPQTHPPDGLPEPPPLDEELDISQGGSGDMQALALHDGSGAPDAAVPPPAPLHSYSPGTMPDQGGTIRADGAFVPKGKPSDWDLPSSDQR
jgi:hypothetical protein